jgi:hypothetical protein
VCMTTDGVLNYWIYWPLTCRTTNNYNCNCKSLTELHTVMSSLHSPTADWTPGAIFSAFLAELYSRLTAHLELRNFAADSESESESELLYDWRFTANQLVLAPRSFRLTTNNSFPTERLRS